MVLKVSVLGHRLHVFEPVLGQCIIVGRVLVDQCYLPHVSQEAKER